MKETSVHPSLLSYLLPEQQKFYLRLRPATPNTSPDNFSSAPFTILNDADPLARTFRGAFVTDFGSTIKEVNLLIQRDTIQWPLEQDSFLNNSIIDQYWQQAMTMRRARTPEHSILLATQVDRQQQLLAFASLFYCRKKEVFFELPCPECGKTLQLCKDDVLLQLAGLAPYSTGLHRYLFCPSCTQSNGQSLWYTREKQANEPSTVHDCRQLFIDYSKFDSQPLQDNPFPCLNCQDHELCYGSQQAVHDTIFGLAFYPFYMLITERDSLDGFHLLPLLQHKQFPSFQEPSASVPSPTDTIQEKRGEQNHDEAILTIMQKLAQKHKQKAPVSFHKENISSNHISSVRDSDTVDDFSQETVIMGGPENHFSTDEDTVQTVKMPPPDKATFNTTYTPEHPDGQLSEKNPIPENDELAETIILRPGKKS
ncbi:hypothetical protein UWK_02712 [Desulfocapsa sulfexigens DSM 10523]|uniref:Uncharacterized protein n=1 Tax=Desulfocapsa sulfexigens (strain DSM 10523 / SB164P1) TaxID=1167006 RepID=M1P700_DESSD|nr:hypothetical protein [Desulfocapsa sulfexigens]AGF79248.1 hypothetical protein UWK_02712 [Desulfocapsa sulfexigens DSM 10523]